MTRTTMAMATMLDMVTLVYAGAMVLALGLAKVVSIVTIQ